jgi:hypothetical protein
MNLTRPAKEQALYFKYLQAEFQRMLEHNPGASSTKYIAITGILFTVYRLKNTGERLAGFEELIKSHHVYACANNSSMCVLECILIAIDPEQYRKFRQDYTKITPKLKKIYAELFGTKIPEKFTGVDMNKTLELAAEKYHKFFVIYHYDSGTKKYELAYNIGKKPTYDTVNLLLVGAKNKQHLMYIKDIEAVTKLHICPKCKTYCLAATDKGNYHKERFEAHVDKCTGKFKPELCLPPVRTPYVPHIQKNPQLHHI